MPDTLTLKLAHINDTHSHFEPSRIQFTLNHQHEPQPIYVHTGGCARIKAQLDKARNQAEQSGQEFIFARWRQLPRYSVFSRVSGRS